MLNAAYMLAGVDDIRTWIQVLMISIWCVLHGVVSLWVVQLHDVHGSDRFRETPRAPQAAAQRS